MQNPEIMTDDEIDEEIRRSEPAPTAAPWPRLAPQAYQGLAGMVCRAIAPHTESDPVAILMQFLAAFGNVVGRVPFYQIEGEQHFPKLFVALVGSTSKGRKGTSASRIRQLFGLADPEWSTSRWQSGLATGEGLIHAVRDPVSKFEKGEEVVADPGVSDKRLCLIVEEFATVLAQIARPGSILSPLIRDAWGPWPLQTLTKTSPCKATNSHISIIAHITQEELQACLTKTEMANGFANRFLFPKVRRSRLLPHGGNLRHEDLEGMGRDVAIAIKHGARIGRVQMSEMAAKVWEEAYPTLSGDRPGLLGAVLGRIEAQTIRLALIYALLGNSATIEVPHLRAALAVADFLEECARQIFSDASGDPTADAILNALRCRSEGMSRTEIRDLFGRHRSSATISTALSQLATQGRARSQVINGNGRSAEMWFAT